MSTRKTGKVVNWNDARGYGFLSVDGQKDDVFLHVSAFPEAAGRPENGLWLSFVEGRDKRGRLRAEQVRLIKAPGSGGPGRLPRPARLNLKNPRVMFPLGFLAAAFSLSAAGALPYPVLWLYLLFSVVAFTAYALDKHAAIKGRWRTPEATLQGLALLGGWPGALLAQQWLRHKTVKPAFQLVFWIIVVAHVLLFGWFFTSDGSQWLQELLAEVSRG